MKIYPTKNSSVSAKTASYFGFDLGTTYSLMAKVDSANIDFNETHKIPVQLIQFEQKSPFKYDSPLYDEKVASIVALHDGKPFIGNNLYHLKGQDGFELDKNIFYHWKNSMGVNHEPFYPEAVNKKVDMPFKIAGFILKYMRANYLNDATKVLTNSVITVPASFQADQRKDTYKAADLALLDPKTCELIDEPNAAFLGYFNNLTEETKITWAKSSENQVVLVFDFGGGTLDLSLLDVSFNEGIKISNKAISRYNDLGGQDLDQIIAEEYLLPILQEYHPAVETLTTSKLLSQVLPQLSVIAEKLKIGISEKIALNNPNIQNPALKLDGLSFALEEQKLCIDNQDFDLNNIEISADTFSTLLKKIYYGEMYKFTYADKTMTCISKSITDVIEKSNLYATDISAVLYAGGSCYNPLLHNFIQEKLSLSRPLVYHKPDKLVAEGAAIYSYFFFNQNINLIQAITSDDIGVVTKNNKFTEIIPHSTSLPVDVNIPEFYISRDGEEKIKVPICVANKDNIIGTIEFELDEYYPKGTAVTIQAHMSINKSLTCNVIIDGVSVGNGTFNNPYSMRALSALPLNIQTLVGELKCAIATGNKRTEKQKLKLLIQECSNVNDNKSVTKFCEEYINKFDDQDAYIWNLLYCHTSQLGRKKAANYAIERALEIEPDNANYHYNYSLLLPNNDAYNRLLELEIDAEILHIRRALLAEALGLEWRKLANAIVERFENEQSDFSLFERKVLLPSLYKKLGKHYDIPKDIAMDPIETRGLLSTKNNLRIE